MTKELTSEEIVTELLTSNSFVKPLGDKFYMSNPNETLGDFLQNEKLADKPLSKYSFIDESINWGFGN